jgi:hypothetical protein
MKISKNICFFYNENRINYVNILIEETSKYPYITDIFIHTNFPLFSDVFLPYNNGNIVIVYYNLENNELFKKNPLYFPWYIRDNMKNIKDYDVIMYLEDDMLIPVNAINYWFKHKDLLIKNNYNLGFLRIEILDNKEYTTDLAYNDRNNKNNFLTKIVEIDNNKYILNDINTYCAMFIYDKLTYNNFLDSPYFNPNNIKPYDIREKIAIGLHGIGMSHYKGTLIPLIDKEIDKDCRIYHLPNNYVNNMTYWILHSFDDLIRI